MPTPVRTRRRFIGITAAASILALAPGALRLAHAAATAQPAHGIEPLLWRGVALGADAELPLYHPDRAIPHRLLAPTLPQIKPPETLSTGKPAGREKSGKN